MKTAGTACTLSLERNQKTTQKGHAYCEGESVSESFFHSANKTEKQQFKWKFYFFKKYDNIWQCLMNKTCSFAKTSAQRKKNKNRICVEENVHFRCDKPAWTHEQTRPTKPTELEWTPERPRRKTDPELRTPFAILWKCVSWRKSDRLSSARLLRQKFWAIYFSLFRQRHIPTKRAAETSQCVFSLVRFASNHHSSFCHWFFWKFVGRYRAWCSPCGFYSSGTKIWGKDKWQPCQRW